MSDQANPALDVIDRQIKELEAILSQASQDLNTVAGSERVAKWKTRTIPLIAQHVGSQEAQRFSAKRPGPSFTQDLLEELQDEVETYRSFLQSLAKEIKKKGNE